MKVKTIIKPWGYELLWAKTPLYAAKVLHIRKGERLSLQSHSIKDETIKLDRGSVILTLEGKDILMNKKESYHIPPGTPHRLTALTYSKILEVSTPYLNNIVRLENDYGRVE